MVNIQQVAKLIVAMAFVAVVGLFVLFVVVEKTDEIGTEVVSNESDTQMRVQTTPTQDLPSDQTPDNVQLFESEGDVLNGPYWQNLVISTLLDDGTWTPSETILEHASGPDAVVLQTEIGAYDAGDALVVTTFYPENKVGAGQLSFLTSIDQGELWSDPVALTLEGAGGQVPVDPSIYQAPDGTLLLTYQDLRESNDQSDRHAFYVATSKDGVNFMYQGEIYSSQEYVIHPDLIEFKGTWYLFFGVDNRKNEIRFVTGDSYLSFHNEQTTSIEGIPGTAMVDQVLTVYGCDKVHAGVSEYRADENGSLTYVKTHVLQGCAPSPLVFDDGAVAIVRTLSVD